MALFAAIGNILYNLYIHFYACCINYSHFIKRFYFRWGEVDTRFSFCSLASLALLDRLDAISVPNAATFVISCMNFDGGFGVVPGSETHAGQIYCCLGALAIAGRQ